MAEPESKTFSLKPSESNFLQFIHQHQQAVFAAALSNIASERLAYHVTPGTQFELNGDFTQIKISEVALPEAPKDDAPAVVSAPDRKEPKTPEKQG